MSVTPDLIREKLIAEIGAIHVVCNMHSQMKPESQRVTDHTVYMCE